MCFHRFPWALECVLKLWRGVKLALVTCGNYFVFREFQTLVEGENGNPTISGACVRPLTEDEGNDVRKENITFIPSIDPFCIFILDASSTVAVDAFTVQYCKGGLNYITKSSAKRLHLDSVEGAEHKLNWRYSLGPQNIQSAFIVVEDNAIRVQVALGEEGLRGESEELAHNSSIQQPHEFSNVAEAYDYSNHEGQHESSRSQVSLESSTSDSIQHGGPNAIHVMQMVSMVPMMPIRKTYILGLHPGSYGYPGAIFPQYTVPQPWVCHGNYSF